MVDYVKDKESRFTSRLSDVCSRINSVAISWNQRMGKSGSWKVQLGGML